MRFPIDDDVAEILDLLRESPLAWMADEIESGISEGKLEEVDGDTLEFSLEPRRRGPRPRLYKTFPLNRDEQRSVALRTIKTYLADVPDMWVKAQHTISEEMDVRIEVLSEEGSTVVTPFDETYYVQTERLRGLLEEATR